MQKPKLVLILNRKTIQSLVKEIATKISKDYQGEELVLIAVLKGAFVFFADLIRELTIPVKIDFIQASSYGGNTHSSGSVNLIKDVNLPIGGRHVILVEDIVDTGLTVSRLIEHLKPLNPKSIKVCAFINKLERREIKTKVDYPGWTTHQGFIVGYGLDFAEEYRHLPDIYHVQDGLE